MRSEENKGFSDTEKAVRERLFNHKNSTRVKVRFNDTDAMGVVHFKNYMVYFDDGFVSFMNELGKYPVEQVIHDGIALGVKHVDITYKGSAVFGDYIIVETKVDRIGTKSITFQHEIYRESDREVLAIVKATRFAMNLEKKELINILDFYGNFI